MSDIFSLIDESVDEEGSGTSINVTETQGTQEQPWWKSVSGDVLKGIVEGLDNFGQAMGPIPQYDNPFEESTTPKVPLTQFLDEQIPTDDTFVGGTLRRSLGIAPLVLTNPGQSVLPGLGMSGASGVAGETAKAAGFGETGQAVAESLPFLAPAASSALAKRGTGLSQKVASSKMIPKRIRDVFSKRAASQNEINELIDFAEKQGITAEELTPLLQGETKKTFLSKISARGAGVQSKLDRSKQAIGEVANSFKTGKFSEVVLGEQASNKLIGSLQDVLYDMPAKTRNVIMEDFQQLAASPKDVKSIVKFFRDIGSNYGSNKGQLGRLKEPLVEALSTVSPELARDFNITNKLFQRYYDISSKLKPNIASQILEASTVPKVTFGAVTGNYPLIAESVGEVAARKLSSEMLTNPKFQDLSRKMIAALNKNKFALANKIKEEYIRYLKDDYPEVAAQMQGEIIEEFTQ